MDPCHGDAQDAVGYLCRSCYSRLGGQLRQVGAVVVWLQLHLAGASAGLNDKVSGSREDPIPLRLSILDLIGPDSTRFVCGVAEDQRGRESIRGMLAHYDDQLPTPLGPGAFATELALHLAANLKWISDQEWSLDLLSEMTETMSVAHSLVPWREEVVRDAAPCMTCGSSAVVIHVGRGISRCVARAGGCGREEPLSEYRIRDLLLSRR